jgi:hypothetical protein
LQIREAVRCLARADAARSPMTIPALIIVLVCVAADGCILFTDPVNSKPSVFIVPPTGPFVRGQTIKIMASASDPDGDTVRLEWSTKPGDCPMTLDLAQRPATTFQSPPGDPTFKLMFQPTDPSTVCVWVLATDPQGATAFDAHTVTSDDRPPEAVITILEPTSTARNGLYELYSTFHLSGASSHDPDGDNVTMPMWHLTLPQDAPMLADCQNATPMDPSQCPKLVRCPSATPTDFLQCLDVGGVAGTYTVGLIVSDGTKPSQETTTTFTVDWDHPACVSKTEPSQAASPIVLDPGESKTLTITEILDDGSPLPVPVEGTHTPPTFAWTLSRNGGAPTLIAGYENVNSLTLPANSYATGDVVVVSVTISDGVSMHLQPACDPGCPAGCPQTAQWTVEYR